MKQTISDFDNEILNILVDGLYSKVAMRRLNPFKFPMFNNSTA